MEVDASTIKEMREKPSLFVEKMLDDPLSKNTKKPYSYQKKFLDSDSERKVIVGGRQTGKTTMMCWLAVHEFSMYANRKILLVAPTKRQAKNFMKKLKAEIPHWLRNEDKYGLEEVMKLRIEGKNGSWIQAVPALEETIRGLTINSTFVDEGAFIERQVFTSVISPMMATTDGQFNIGSTPWGKDGYLYNKFNDKNWSDFQFASSESPDIPAKQIEEWRRDMTDMEFKREVLGRFTEKKNSFFKNKDISRCLAWAKKAEREGNIIFPDQNGRNCFMGADPATGGEDSAVITSIDTQGNVFDIKEITNCEIPELEGEIRALINRNDRNYIGGLIEENGIGEGTVHRFENEFDNIKGFRTTLRSKESIYQTAKNEMQSGKISIPDRETLRRQLRSIQYEMTRREHKKIHAPEGEHDDFADSFVLAVGAMFDDNFAEKQGKIFSVDGKGSSRKNRSSSRENRRNRRNKRNKGSVKSIGV